MKKVIVLATSKGGAGKSTLARSLASHWYHSGLRPCLIDADPQGSLINRHNPEGPIKDIPVIAEPEENVSNVILEVSEKYSPVIVDTGGFRNRTTIRALSVAEMAIIPLKPSADDVQGALETFNLVSEINETPERVNNKIIYRMIMTMTQIGTIISRHVKSEIEEMGLKIMKSELYHRVAYPEAAIKGLSPCTTDPEGPAARDIAQIAQEINMVEK